MRNKLSRRYLVTAEKSNINIISTIISVRTRPQSKTILCFTRRIEENVQANNCKNGREGTELDTGRKMELSIKWK